MVKKEITFKDYNGVERTEEHYFNLNEAELMRLQLGEVGGFDEKIKQVYSKRDVPTIMNLFEDLIKKSYGVKSPDGREFIKSEEITRSFIQTEAYSVLFMELLSDDEKASAFFNAVINADAIDTRLNEKTNAGKTALTTV